MNKTAANKAAAQHARFGYFVGEATQDGPTFYLYCPVCGTRVYAYTFAWETKQASARLRVALAAHFMEADYH